MQWLSIAKALPLEGRRKIRHCSTSPSAYVNNSSRGYSLRCFRCGETDFVPKDENSLKEIADRRRQNLKEMSGKANIPSDAVSCTEASDNALIWLLKGGLSPEEADVHGVRWHSKSDRLLIPLKDETGKTTGIIARAVNGEKPKYFALHQSEGIHFPRQPTQRSICVVEDVLSSIAVNKAGMDSAAVVGTSVSAEIAYRLTKNKCRVVVFMDPDTAGDKGFMSIKKTLQLYPVEVHRAFADRDPKYLTRQEIQDAVARALRS